MRKINYSLDYKDVRFLNVYFVTLYFDIKCIKENYFNNLTNEEKTIIENDFNILQNHLDFLIQKYNLTNFADEQNLSDEVQDQVGNIKNFDDCIDFDLLKNEHAKILFPIYYDCFRIEEECKNIACRMWENTLSDVKNFDNSKFNLLVYKISDNTTADFKSFRHYLTDNKSRRLSTTYITEKNTTTFLERKSEYGLIYTINKKNFLGGCYCDAYSYETPLTKEEKNGYITPRNDSIYTIFEENEHKVFSGLYFEYSRAYATKTVTPKRVENSPYQQNYNEIVLDFINSKPQAVFYFYYGNKFITACNMQDVKDVAKYYNIPIIAINRMQGIKDLSIEDDMFSCVSMSLENSVKVPSGKNLDETLNNYFKVYNKVMETDPQTKEEFTETIKSLNYETKQNDFIQDID